MKDLRLLHPLLLELFPERRDRAFAFGDVLVLMGHDGFIVEGAGFRIRYSRERGAPDAATVAWGEKGPTAKASERLDAFLAAIDYLRIVHEQDAREARLSADRSARVRK